MRFPSETRAVAVLRVRFDTNTDSNSVWSDDSAPGNFSLQLLDVDPDREFVRFALRGGAQKRFPIRGVLLAGGFRTHHTNTKHRRTP